MTIRTLAILAALAAPAFAEQPVSGDRAYDRPYSGGARETACEKGCIAPHDSSVIGCKLFKSADQTDECVANADAKKISCERGCRDRAMERQRKAGAKPRAETGPREGRMPNTTPSN